MDKQEITSYLGLQRVYFLKLVSSLHVEGRGGNWVGSDINGSGQI